MKKLLFIIMLVCISSCNNKKIEQERAAEQERIEQQRIDSIRQDSIARRSFTSPDLAFNDLHGDVKKCVVNDNERQTYTFDENGKWTNEPQWDESDKKYCPERTKNPKVTRDKEGYITRIYCGEGTDHEYDDISWEDNKIKTYNWSTYSYDNDFVITKDEPSLDCTWIYTYCNYEVDGMGNWVKRDEIYKHVYDFPPHEVSYGIRTETRNITYHKSNGECLSKIPNNAKQEQALDALISYYQKKDQEKNNPEWIYGTWECKGTKDYGPYLGGVKSFTSKVIISNDNIKVYFDGELNYNGNYEIEDGEIKYNRRNGMCDVLPIDYSNKRLEFGDGIYFNNITSSSYTTSNSYSSSHSSSNSSRNNSSFRSPNDVMSYLSGKTFKDPNNQLRVRISYDAIYLNGTASSAAPRISNITSTSATIRGQSPYMGGQDIVFFLNYSNGTLTLQSGEKLYLYK